MKFAIFKVNQLGDNVVFLPVVQTLRKIYPEWELMVLTSPLASALFEADIPAERRMIIPTSEFLESWRHPGRFGRILRKLRVFTPDACLIGEDQGNAAHVLARLSGARLRVGVESTFLKVPAGLTVTVPRLAQPRAALLSWELGRALVLAAGGREWPDVPPPPDLRHLTAGQAAIVGRVVIHPGGSRVYQRWPLKRYAELATRLSGHAQVLWIESMELDRPTLPSSVQKIRPESLSELVQALASAELFVGNNSGPMNLVFALGRPAVIINGPTTRLWDPVWFPERVRMLRDWSLSCLPCDTRELPASICRNTLSPLACLNIWAVADIEKLCLTWREHWSAHGSS